MERVTVCGLACPPTSLDTNKGKSKAVKLPSKMKEKVETEVAVTEPKKTQRHKVLVSRSQVASQSSSDEDERVDGDNVDEIIHTVLTDVTVTAAADDKEKSDDAADADDEGSDSESEDKAQKENEKEEKANDDSGDDSSSESESLDGNGKGSGKKAAEAEKYILKRKNTAEKSASDAESEAEEAQSEEGNKEDGKEKPASDEEATFADKPNPEPAAGDKEETGEKEERIGDMKKSGVKKKKENEQKSDYKAEPEAEAQSEMGNKEDGIKKASSDQEAASAEKPIPEPVADKPKRPEPPVTGGKEETDGKEKTDDKKKKRKKKKTSKKVHVYQEADADAEGTEKVVEKPVSEVRPSSPHTRIDHIVKPKKAKMDPKPKTNLKRTRAEKEATAAANDDDNEEPAVVQKKKKARVANNDDEEELSVVQKKKKASVANNDDEEELAVVQKKKKKKARVANDVEEEEPAVVKKKIKKARVANDDDGTNKIAVLSNKFDALFGAFKPCGDPLWDMAVYGANAGFCQLGQDQLAKMDDQWKAMHLELLPGYLKRMDLQRAHLNMAYEALNRNFGSS